MICLKHGVRVPVRTGEYVGLDIERVIIGVQSTDELVTHTRKTKFAPFSLAWVIDSGDIYALNSSDEWIKQSNISLAISL